MALLGPLRGEVSTSEEPPSADPPPGAPSGSLSTGKIVFFAAAAFGLLAIFSKGKSEEDLDGF